MTSLRDTLVSGIRRIDAVSPAVTGRVANVAFFATTRQMKVRESDRVTHDAARRESIRIGGHDVVTYQWGAGARAALLMHGWDGRASQFATLVRDLIAEGWRVVAFDAPAHGDSSGRRTDARDWVAAARHLAASEGPFELVIGHSFGGFASLAAVREGVQARRMVTISAAGSVQAFHDEFERMLRLSPRASAAFERAFHRRLGISREEGIARFDSVTHPLPPEVELLIVHDEDDPRVTIENAHALHRAHGERARLLVTQGLGHNRILGADRVLDAVIAFAADGPHGIDRADASEQRGVRGA